MIITDGGTPREVSSDVEIPEEGVVELAMSGTLDARDTVNEVDLRSVIEDGVDEVAEAGKFSEENVVLGSPRLLIAGSRLVHVKVLV